MRDTKCHCWGGAWEEGWEHRKSSFPCDHSATGHCPQEFWGQGQVIAAILGPRGGYELPLQDLTAGAKHCHHSPGSMDSICPQKTQSSAKTCPCCPRSVQTAAAPRRPKSRCRRLPPHVCTRTSEPVHHVSRDNGQHALRKETASQLKQPLDSGKDGRVERHELTSSHEGASLVSQMIKILPAIYKARAWFLGWKDPLEKGMAIYSSIHVWRTSWTEKSSKQQTTGLQRVGHDWVTNTFTSTSHENTKITTAEQSSTKTLLSRFSRVQLCVTP